MQDICISIGLACAAASLAISIYGYKEGRPLKTTTIQHVSEAEKYLRKKARRKHWRLTSFVQRCLLGSMALFLAALAVAGVLG